MSAISITAQPSPAAASDPGEPAITPPSEWTKHGIDIYLLGDAYGGINFNHPDSGYNKFYNFDDKANAIHLNLAKVALEKSSGMLGFRLDAGIGRTLDLISATDTAPRGLRYLEQFYAEFRPPKTHGLEIDFGKFATSAGSELIESNVNWVYSRSLLFSLACPYYHFGLRTSIPVTKSFVAGFQLVDGWNNVGTSNGFSTIGFTGSYTWKKLTWANTYYTGKQSDGIVQADRKLIDSNILIKANAATNFYVNFDYGLNRRPGEDAVNWFGIAVAGRRQLTKHFGIAGRGEWFRDSDGFATGTPQTVKEVTATGEWKVNEHLISRLEYRRDMSDQPFFDRGSGVMVAKSQSTLTLALMTFFGPTK